MLEADGSRDESILGSFFGQGCGDSRRDTPGHEFERPQERSTELEERLYAATVSWKRERRQFQAQIQELRRALEQTRTEVEESKSLKTRFEEMRRYSQQLEIRCEEQSVQAASEREKLQARIRDLEKQIVEWMDHSNNTHRGTQSAQRKMEAELAAHKREVEIESERKFRSEQVRWKKVERMLEGEIERLKGALEVVSADKTPFLRRLFNR